MKVLEAKDLVKTYVVGDNKIHAINGISLNIKKGDYLAIVGKSGSGKSTLMHVLGLLNSPTSGKLLLGGTPVEQLNETELAKIRNSEIGFVFQSFNLLARATALENVMLPLQYGDVPKTEWKKKALAALETVELSDRVNNKSNELSGGQKQRVALARALVTEPAIIFADEPTGNLDTKTGEDIVNLFNTLNKKGITIVMVTHDTDLAKAAKRKIVLSDGKIISET